MVIGRTSDRQKVSLLLVLSLCLSLIYASFKAAPVAAAPVLMTSWTGSQGDARTDTRTLHPSSTNTISAQGQSFNTTLEGKEIDSVQFYFDTYTDYGGKGPTGMKLQAQLFQHSGAFGASSVPVGLHLAFSDVLVNPYCPPDMARWWQFNFSGANRYHLVFGMQYCITLVCISYTTGWITQYGDLNGGQGHDGNYVYYYNSSWDYLSSRDYFFKLYVDDAGGPHPLTATIYPSSADIYVGQTVTFQSAVSWGPPPYSYQWYCNNTAIPDATSDLLDFVANSSGYHAIHLHVTDSDGTTSDSNEAHVTVRPSSIRYLSLPGGSYPWGIEYNPFNNCTYVALREGYYNDNQTLAEINKDNLTVNYFKIMSWYPSFGVRPSPCEVAIDNVGNVWVTILGFQSVGSWPGPPDFWWNVIRFNITSRQVEYIPLPVHEEPTLAITYHKGYIWITTGWSTLIKIEPETLAMTCYNITVNPSGGLLNWWIEGDGDLLWISDQEYNYNKVLRFNTTSEQLELPIVGVRSPAGIEVVDDLLFIAENEGASEPRGDTGRMLVVNKNNYADRFEIDTGAEIAGGGPYMVMQDSLGYIWFTDMSSHIGIITRYGGVLQLSTNVLRCLHMTEVATSSDSREIWFSGVGSAYIGIKDASVLGGADVNRDGRVELMDFYIVAQAYLSTPEKPNWNPKADVNEDGRVEMMDFYEMTQYYGKTI